MHVNHLILPKDQVRSPGIGKLRAILRSKAAFRKKLFVVAVGVSKARRRIKIQQKDWGYQACRARPGKVWLNCVGIHGVASGAYCWA